MNDSDETCEDCLGSGKSDLYYMAGYDDPDTIYCDCPTGRAFVACPEPEEARR